MAVNETWVTGRKFRRLIDKENMLWQISSFITKAKDILFEDGMSAEEKIGNFKGVTSDISSVTESGFAADAKAVKDQVATLQSNFQDGVDAIANAITKADKSATPKNNELATVVSSIGTLATNRYNAGVTKGKDEGSASGAILYGGHIWIWYNGVVVRDSNGEAGKTNSVSKTITLKPGTYAWALEYKPGANDRGYSKITIGGNELANVNANWIEANKDNGKTYGTTGTYKVASNTSCTIAISLGSLGHCTAAIARVA